MTIEDLRSRVRGLDKRLFQDELYRFVWNEIESDRLDPAAKSRALADGVSNETEMKSAYIRHRILSLKDELQLLERQFSAIQADQEREKRDAEFKVKRDEKTKRHNEIGEIVRGAFLFILSGIFSLVLVGGMFAIVALNIPESVDMYINVLLIIAFFGWLCLWGFFTWKLCVPAKAEDQSEAD